MHSLNTTEILMHKVVNQNDNFLHFPSLAILKSKRASHRETAGTMNA